jgi:DNA-binding transcriptional LysR family regulator
MAGLSGIDLNLLAVLSALLEERNVTRAGMRLRLSQPTISGALARLRQHFGDELLVRSGREYQLTPVAAQLLPAVREALAQADRTLSAPAPFDPATSERRFSIAISGQSLLSVSALVKHVRAEAPRVRLEAWPVTPVLLEAGRAGLLGYDVLVAPAGFWADGQPEVIARDRLVYVADPANPRLRDGTLTAADLQALPHAAARLPHPGADPAAAALERLGITPAVVLTTGGWLPLAFLVAGTDLVAAIPERLARRVAAAAGVTIAAITEPALADIELTEAAWWHPMRAADPALTWLRTTLREVAAQLDSTSPANASAHGAPPGPSSPDGAALPPSGQAG